ncbi:hypothetical protein [Paraflavitalea speifideaquila]|nr:hypothetical protein [Paraflavitalea speifideiaquila]
MNAAPILPANYISNDLREEATDDIHYAEMDGLHALKPPPARAL